MEAQVHFTSLDSDNLEIGMEVQAREDYTGQFYKVELVTEENIETLRKYMDKACIPYYYTPKK